MSAWRACGAAALVLALVALVSCAAPSPAPPPEGWEDDVREWRENRARGLASENGWLTLVGLFWLDEERRYTIGSGADAEFKLPAGSAPEAIGTFIREGTVVRFEAAPGAGATVNDTVLAATVLRSDREEKPDVVRAGRVSMTVIDRDGRLGIRAKDPDNETRTTFAGLDYFPIDPAYRVVAKLERFEAPREVTIPTATGIDSAMEAPGLLRFRLGDAEHAILGFGASDAESLFVIFRDATSSESTYGAGRYLDATRETDGTYVLDFNRAYNPPCAFTSFATCPYPPPENILRVPVEAGEKRYAGAHS